MSYVGNAPPVSRSISITRGCDQDFTLQRVEGDVLTDWGEGTTIYMWIDIDRTNPVRVDANVSGPYAVFSLQSEVLDQAKTGTRFRCVLDFGDTEIPIFVGRFERHDG